MPLDRRDFLALLGASLARPSLALPADKSEPLKIAVNAEFGMPGGFAAQSIEKGVALAIAASSQALSSCCCLSKAVRRFIFWSNGSSSSS